MPVEAQTVEYVYLGDGVSTIFSFPSKFLSPADVVVGINGEEQTSGYSVNGAENESGGTVVFTSAPASGSRVALLRRPPVSQLLDFVNGQTVLEGLLDNGLDKLTMVAQYLLRSVQKSVRASEFDPDAIGTLPKASTRAGKLLGFDSGGAVVVVDPSTIAQAGTDVPMWAFQKALRDDGSLWTVINSPLFPGDPTDDVAIAWTTGAAVSPGDLVATLVQTITAKTDAQMTAIFTSARTKTL